MILGQGPAITSDTGSEPEQVSKAHQYQLCNDSPWVTEARNALFSQDPLALSDIRQDCTTILVMSFEETKVQDIQWVELKATSNKHIYTIWKLAWEQCQHFTGSSQTGMYHLAQAWGFKRFMCHPP